MLGHMHNDPMQSLMVGNQPESYYQTRKNILYVFSPRNFGLQVRRPLQYTIDDRFIGQVGHILEEGHDQQIPIAVKQYMSDPMGMNIAFPSTGFSTVDFNQIAYLWTFLLIAHDVQSKVGVLAASPHLRPFHKNRVLYYGFFTDEPVNITTHTPNLNAPMVVTHKSMITELSSFGSRSTTQQDVVADIYVTPGMTQMCTNEDTYVMTPESLITNYERTTGGELFGNYESAALHPNGAPITINTSTTVPQNNVTKIVQSISTANDVRLSNQYGGTLSSGPMADLLSQPTDQDYYQTTLLQQLHDADRMAHYGVSDREYTTLGSIAAQFDPEIQPITQEQASLYGVVDQRNNTAANIHASMLMQVGPVIIANAGISNLVFEYDSYYDQLQVHSVSSLIGSTDQETQHRLRAVIASLKSQVFPILQARDHFRLMATLSCGHLSRCILNFYCDSTVNDAVYEVPTIAGGMLCNLLGNSSVTGHNAGELNMFVDALTQTDRDLGTPYTPTSFPAIDLGDEYI